MNRISSKSIGGFSLVITLMLAGLTGCAAASAPEDVHQQDADLRGSTLMEAEEEQASSSRNDLLLMGDLPSTHPSARFGPSPDPWGSAQEEDGPSPDPWDPRLATDSTPSPSGSKPPSKP